MTSIHPTAIVHPRAELGEGVEVGPYALVGENVQVGEGATIGPHVALEGWTRIGKDCQIFHGAALGGPPQDRKFKGEKTFLEIGDSNLIREYVTIHRASGEGNVTRIGSRNLFMAYSHVGHNCLIGDDVMITNQVGVSGHCVIEDRVCIGGLVGIHQFVRIGKLAMVGGYSKLVQDVPPFMLADGRPAKVCGLNLRGLRRAGVPPATRAALKRAYKILYRSNLNLSLALQTIVAQLPNSPEIAYLVEFLSRRKEGYAGRQLDITGRLVEP